MLSCRENHNVKRETGLHRRLFPLLRLPICPDSNPCYILNLGKSQVIYITKLLKLVTFLDKLLLLTLLREQLLVTQCCWWLISCILAITEANVTWLERKSLLIHPYMEGKPRGFIFCFSRAKDFWYGLHNTSGKPGSCLLWPAVTKLCKIQSNGRELQNSHMPISLHEKYHNPCKTKI